MIARSKESSVEKAEAEFQSIVEVSMSNLSRKILRGNPLWPTVSKSSL